MNYLVKEEHNGERIDKFLVGVMDNVSRTDVQKLIASGEVKVGGAPASKNFRVETGMVVVVEKLIEKEASTLEPEEIPLDIVYEDDDIVVLNKPRNLVVHPGSGVSKGTLADRDDLRRLGPGHVQPEPRVRPVHSPGRQGLHVLGQGC